MIRFIKNASPVGFSHFEGEEVQFSETTEKELIESGFAVEVETEKAVAKKPKTEKAVSK
jgi:hypothetical protein